MTRAGPAGALLSASLAMLSARAAQAQPGITFGAYASASYSINANHPASGLNQLRVFDFRDRTLQLDLVELVAQRRVSKPGELGFRVDADAGQSMPRVTAANGLFRHLDGTAGNFDLRQIVVSYIAPIGSGVRLDAGKFTTHIGLDVIDGVDGANENASRGFLFGYGEPFTHTGLKATYAVSPTVSAMVQVSNGWDVVRDNNSARSIGAQLALAPSEKVSVSLNLMAGPERTAANGDSRLLADVVGTWTPSAEWWLGLDALAGTEPNAAGPGAAGRWTGATLVARRALSGSVSLAVRGEVFDDAHGDRTGASQTLSAVTVTPSIRLSPHVLVRADFRLDRSTARVFERDTHVVRSQPTMLVNAVVRF